VGTGFNGHRHIRVLDIFNYPKYMFWEMKKKFTMWQR
jgi:hypothetical protein